MTKGKKNCICCNKQLIKDEVALSLKMLGRNITQFYCISCLAEALDCNQDDLVIKVQEFKEQGCALFL